MNRADLQKLAEERLADAELLLANGRFGGAYYLSGYVVECALKACIAKLTKAEDFPDLDLAKRVYTHALENLARAARIDIIIDRLSKKDREFARNWALVNRWSEHSRYQSRGPRDSKAMFRAVSDTKHGVLQCIKRYW
ncbi:MAG TPA: HEPN domain-containing protein [Terriglobia bacterium]|nr:HEPN domain-containing protein [Terriglobia bacterium]